MTLDIVYYVCVFMCNASWFYVFGLSNLRRCGPRLSAEAADKLKNRYVMMRSGARQHERETSKRTSIPITVR